MLRQLDGCILGNRQHRRRPFKAAVDEQDVRGAQGLDGLVPCVLGNVLDERELISAIGPDDIGPVAAVAPRHARTSVDDLLARQGISDDRGPRAIADRAEAHDLEAHGAGGAHRRESEVNVDALAGGPLIPVGQGIVRRLPVVPQRQFGHEDNAACGRVAPRVPEWGGLAL